MAEGWMRPHTATKRHYFVDGMSLCRKWGFPVDDDLQQGNDDSPDHCATCKKKLKKLKG